MSFSSSEESEEDSQVFNNPEDEVVLPGDNPLPPPTLPIREVGSGSASQVATNSPMRYFLNEV